MKRNAIAKFIIQAVALGFGLLGLIWVCMGIYFLITGIRESDMFVMFIMTPMFLILGGIVIIVAWQALRHFGPNAIRNVVALVAFSAYCVVSTFLEPLQKATGDLKGDLYVWATVFFPVLFAFLLYRVLSRKLIKMTGADAPDNGMKCTVDSRESGSMSG